MTGLHYTVPSSTAKRYHVAHSRWGWGCSCPHHQRQQVECKHILRCQALLLKGFSGSQQHPWHIEPTDALLADLYRQIGALCPPT